MSMLLHIRNGTVVGEFALEPGSLRVGRNPDNDIRLEDSAVSGNHAVITIKTNPYMDALYDVFVDDLGSTNGTLINGQPTTHQRLHDADILQVGTHEFKYVADTKGMAKSTRILLSDEEP